METGKVKFYNKTKGYGFIVNEGNGEEVFFHISGMKCTELNKEDNVKYEITSGERGLSAINVEPVK